MIPRGLSKVAVLSLASLIAGDQPIPFVPIQDSKFELEENELAVKRRMIILIDRAQELIASRNNRPPIDFSNWFTVADQLYDRGKAKMDDLIEADELVGEFVKQFNQLPKQDQLDLVDGLKNNLGLESFDDQEQLYLTYHLQQLRKALERGAKLERADLSFFTKLNEDSAKPLLKIAQIYFDPVERPYDRMMIAMHTAN